MSNINMFRRKVLIRISFLGGLFWILLIQTANGQMDLQSEFPEVGKPCPNFTLRNISYYSRKEANLVDFSGKWLVLDFWNRGCGACVMSFPRTSELQKKFQDKVQFMMVGIEDKENMIRPMYAKFRQREKLAMPCAFDSTLANRFDLYTAPYIIVIDDHGIVQAITSSVDSSAIVDLLAGKHPRLNKAYRVHEDIVEDGIPFNAEKPYLINGNGGLDSSFLFRTVLTKWDPNINHWYHPASIDEDVQKGMFQVLGVTLETLYNFAYFGLIGVGGGKDYGNVSGKPILDVKDSSIFAGDYKKGTYMFSYSLIAPPSTSNKDQFMRILQGDLENYFGYRARIETRKITCLKLIASPLAQSNLPTKGGPYYYKEIPKANFEAKNWPMEDLLNLIRANSKYVIINETGISGNIDISMDCLQTDFNDIRRALKLNGLDLVPYEREMRVLVITDRK